MLPFLKQIFSEPTGEPSFSRLASGIALCFHLGWITYIVGHTHALPDFTGITQYSAWTFGTLYGANKVATKLSDTFQTRNQ